MPSNGMSGTRVPRPVDCVRCCALAVAMIVAMQALAGTPPAADSSAPALSTSAERSSAAVPAASLAPSGKVDAVATPMPTSGNSAGGTITIDSKPTSADATQQALLAKAVTMIKAHQFDAAITGPLDAVIASFETRYGHDAKTQYYSVRSIPEALLYMSMAAKDKHNAEARGPEWQEAYFLKGNALNSLGRFKEASKTLQKALALAPMNAHTMVELAFSYENLQRTTDALNLCDSAVAMSAFSPEAFQQSEKARALRCKGFNLTNLHRYDNARQAYDNALKLNPDDAISKHELEYIRKQVSAQQPLPSG